MRLMIMTAAAATMLASCGSNEAPANNVVETAVALTPGEYEISATVDELRSTDQTTPATSSKVGAPPVVSRTCVGPDNAIEPAAFAEADESCTASDTYVRNGRMNLQYKCNRPGKGTLTLVVDGDFTADGFEAQVRSGTFFSGSGDYDLVRSFTAKRVGECTAKAG